VLTNVNKRKENSQQSFRKYKKRNLRIFFGIKTNFGKNEK